MTIESSLHFAFRDQSLTVSGDPSKLDTYGPVCHLKGLHNTDDFSDQAENTSELAQSILHKIEKEPPVDYTFKEFSLSNKALNLLSGNSNIPIESMTFSGIKWSHLSYTDPQVQRPIHHLIFDKVPIPGMLLNFTLEKSHNSVQEMTLHSKPPERRDKNKKFYAEYSHKCLEKILSTFSKVRKLTLSCFSLGFDSSYPFENIEKLSTKAIVYRNYKFILDCPKLQSLTLHKPDLESLSNILKLWHQKYPDRQLNKVCLVQTNATTQQKDDFEQSLVIQGIKIALTVEWEDVEDPIHEESIELDANLREMEDFYLPYPHSAQIKNRPQTKKRRAGTVLLGGPSQRQAETSSLDRPQHALVARVVHSIPLQGMDAQSFTTMRGSAQVHSQANASNYSQQHMDYQVIDSAAYGPYITLSSSTSVIPQAAHPLAMAYPVYAQGISFNQPQPEMAYQVVNPAIYGPYPFLNRIMPQAAYPHAMAYPVYAQGIPFNQPQPEMAYQVVNPAIYGPYPFSNRIMPQPAYPHGMAYPVYAQEIPSNQPQPQMAYQVDNPAAQEPSITLPPSNDLDQQPLDPLLLEREDPMQSGIPNSFEHVDFQTADSADRPYNPLPPSNNLDQQPFNRLLSEINDPMHSEIPNPLQNIEHSQQLTLDDFRSSFIEQPGNGNFDHDLY